MIINGKTVICWHFLYCTSDLRGIDLDDELFINNKMTDLDAQFKLQVALGITCKHEWYEMAFAVYCLSPMFIIRVILLPAQDSINE